MLPEAKLKLFVVEDQPLFKELLTSFLNTVPDFDLVGSASSVEQTKSAIDDLKPDVLILDIDLPDGNGVGLAASLRRIDPNLGVLSLSRHPMGPQKMLQSHRPLAGHLDQREHWTKSIDRKPTQQQQLLPAAAPLLERSELF